MRLSQRVRQPSLTVWSACNVVPGRVAAMLAPLRELDPEVLLVVDDTVPQDWDDGYRRVADRVVRVPFPGRYSPMYSWVRTLCRGDWILQLDADEIPAASLAAEVAAAIADPRITSAWLTRHWLYGAPGRFLEQWPWHPDYVLRLFRNDPALLRFPGVVHRPLEAIGPRRFLSAPLYHANLLLSSYEQREARASQYEAEWPGVVTGGLPLNEAFYLPERREQLRSAPVPALDRALIEAFLAADGTASGRRRGRVERVAAEQVMRGWEQRPLTPDAYRAQITAASKDLRIVASSWRHFDLDVLNEGDETWPGGLEAHPLIRLTYRWRRPDNGVVVEQGVRTPLPAPLHPGERARVPLLVNAPVFGGPHRLEIDLVHEGVRWFGSPLELEVDVLAAAS
jgi:hypothetical protein